MMATVLADAAPPASMRLDRAILRWQFPNHRDALRLPDVESRTVGGMLVSHISGGPTSGWRDRAMIDEEDEAFVGVVCNLGGREICYADGWQMESREGDVLLWRSDAELSFEVKDPSSKLIILVPQRRFGVRFTSGTLPFTWHQPSQSPMGTVLSSFFTTLAANISRMDERAAECAVESGLDMVAKSIAIELDQTANMRTTLFDRVVRFIDRHLEEELSPQMLARVHGISLRYLHLLFARHDSTVSSWIRERRLQRCREELASPESRQSLTEIAQRWRFCDSAHFSRLFKQRFGMAPRNWRAAHSQAESVLRHI